MSFETGAFDPNRNAPQSQFGRLRERAGASLTDAINSPELRQHLREVAQPIGGAAVRGAIEGSGVLRYDEKSGTLKVKKLGVLRAAINPAGAAKRAAVGATRGAYSEARNATYAAGVDTARAALDGAFSSPAAGEVPTPNDPFRSSGVEASAFTPANPWETPQATANMAPDPFQGGAPRYEADPFAPRPQEQFQANIDPFRANTAPQPAYSPASSNRDAFTGLTPEQTAASWATPIQAESQKTSFRDRLKRKSTPAPTSAPPAQQPYDPFKSNW